MKKESLLTMMPKLIIVVSLIVGIGAVLGVLGYFGTMEKSEVVVNDEIENEEIEDDIEEGIITEIKYVCEQETNKNKDGCYIRNARIIALTDYNKAKTICGLASEPRKDDCDLQILAIVDIGKLKAKCEDAKDRTEKEQCYNILILKVSETDFNEAVKLCEIKSSSKDNCYASVAEKISFTRSTEIYSKALTICDKIDWQELKESCKENCKWNYEYEQEYNETADWKTYRNTIHNYEIKYPDDSVSARELSFDISLATERSNEVVFIIGDDKESEIDKTSCLTIESESLIEEQFNLSLSELIYEVTDDYKKKELININGEEVLKLSFEGGGGLEFTNRRGFLDNEDKDIFFIKHNNMIFIMTLYIIQEDKNKINSNRIFNQILSTLKFIEKDEAVQNKDVLIILDKMEYAKGERIKVILRNNTDKNVEYYENIAWYDIEKFNDKIWEKVEKYSPCFCGDKCYGSPAYLRLDSKKEVFDSWNQIGSGCQKKQVDFGIYRANVKVKIKEEEKIVYSNEFAIKENPVAVASITTDRMEYKIDEAINGIFNFNQDVYINPNVRIYKFNNNDWEYLGAWSFGGVQYTCCGLMSPCGENFSKNSPVKFTWDQKVVKEELPILPNEPKTKIQVDSGKYKIRVVYGDKSVCYDGVDVEFIIK